MNNTIEKYYNKQLFELRESSKEFAQKHPNIAPMLNDVSTDPDTERLLQGTAYLDAILHKKIDDDFPELLYEFINTLYPYYLKPMPSISIVKFSHENITVNTKVQQGTKVKSQKYDNVNCEFQTAWEANILPLSINKLKYEYLGDESSSLDISFLLNGGSLKDANSLEFYLNGNIYSSTNLAMLLTTCVLDIEIYVENKKVGNLPKNSVEQICFNSSDTVLPSQDIILNSYKLLQEYFLFPNKALFFKFNNLDMIHNLIGGKDFELKFNFNRSFGDMDNIPINIMSLYCVPIVNLFKDNAEPVKLQKHKGPIKVIPSSKNSQDYRIYSINDISGIDNFGKSEPYYEFNKFKENGNQRLYKVSRVQSDDNIENCFVELYRTQEQFDDNILVMNIMATNGRIPEKIGIGDIDIPTSACPAGVKFKNIIVPTSMVETPVGNENLWFLISHATINILNINTCGELKSILMYYIGQSNRDKIKVKINKQKVESLEAFTMESSSFLYKGSFLKGIKVKLDIKSSLFGSIGDMHIFLSVLHQFFSFYSSINSFVELEAHDIMTGEVFFWKPKIGTKTIF